MVQSDRALIISCRLSIVTMPSKVVCPQFTMQVFGVQSVGYPRLKEIWALTTVHLQRVYLCTVL